MRISSSYFTSHTHIWKHPALTLFFVVSPQSVLFREPFLWKEDYVCWIMSTEEM